MSILGRLSYQLYFRPLAWSRMITRSGGLLSYWAIERGKREMKRKATTLRTPPFPDTAIPIYFLTGAAFWHLTAFCMYSLAQHTGKLIRPIFVDDGTLDESLYQKMQTQFPGCTILKAKELDLHLAEVLPEGRYPLLNHKRAIYPHIKKLTDIHAGSHGWKMVLDSDMLFFGRPDALCDWLAAPDRPFFLKDIEDAYHYTPQLMASLAGHAVAPRLNVGAVGLQSEKIDWDELERWIGVMENEEGSSYLLEQALSAMVAAGGSPSIADPNKYIVMPDDEEAADPHGLLHHYVAGSKASLYLKAWRHIR